MHTFHTPNPVQLRVELWQGQLNVHAGDTDTTTVELRPSRGDGAAVDLIDHAKVEQRGDEIVVLMPKGKNGLFKARAEVEATIRVPNGSSATLESASADIETQGELGDVKASSGSGDVSVDHAADIEVRTGSGDITTGTVTGSCDIKCGSADVRVGSVGRSADIVAGSGDVVIDTVTANLKVKTGSGDVVVKTVGDGIDAMAGSGDLLLKRVDHGQVKLKTGSGDIAIGVAQGTAAYLDIMTVTGDVLSHLDASDAPAGGDLTAEIDIKSGSGDVLLQRA